MTPEEEIARDIWEIFAEPTPEKRERYEQFRRAEEAAGRKHLRFFSDFRPSHLEQAEVIIAAFTHAVQIAPTELVGLRSVVKEYRNREAVTHPDLLNYALRVFVTHYHGPIALEIPSILLTDPELMAPSVGSGSPEERSTRLAVAAGSPEETQLDWFREDPLLNEHHTHWHVVYNGRNPLERQGEMFFYMHRQMLARYNAERVALGIDPVKAYDDFRKPIPVGYAFGPDIRFARAGYADRAPGASLMSQASVSDQQRMLGRVQDELRAGRFDPAGANTEIIQADRLGAIIEPNGLGDSSKPYFGYHGFGHVTIANFDNEPDSSPNRRDGVMINTTTAIRDVVFWEWHQGVDDIYGLWQKRLPPYNFQTDMPRVLVRKSVDAAGQPYSPDLILCRTADLPAGLPPEQAGVLLFGGANWNRDFDAENATATSPGGNPIHCQTTNTIHTRMETGTIRFQTQSGSPQSYPFPFVNHDEYSLFVRVENLNPVKASMTVRVFLAPDSQTEDRAKWIEVDKFLADLNPLEKKVIYRADTTSSVIRKPAVKNPGAVGMAFDPTQIQTGSNLSTCRCGFPYHMLWPRGTVAGMKFRLMVMLTNAYIDLGGQQTNCGSLSFCGTRNQQYPDRRPLGYPFNRPFAPTKGIAATIAGQGNMASRIITIQQAAPTIGPL